MKLAFPAGVGSFVTSNGTTWLPDANNMVDIGALPPDEFLTAGFTYPAVAGATTSRPVQGLSAGFPFFDTTLGKPVWRNAANSGWVDATGTAA